MAQGNDRREVVQNRLSGATQVQPVTMPSPGVKRAAPVSTGVSSFDQQIGQQLGKFAQGTLGRAVKTKQERSYLDGQMAYQQGKTIEDMQMDGDKWAIEGYRVVNAQEMSSGLLMAQQREIKDGAYESNPDAYRASMVDRMSRLIEQAPDQQTAELVRNQLLEHMPTLVAQHTEAYYGFQEQQAFDSLARSMDTISRDPGAGPALVSFATGAPGSATAGLSTRRRQEAVTVGIVQAFDNDNPMAMSVLQGTDAFNELSVEQKRTIRAADQAFQNRRRQEYDADFIQAERSILRRAAGVGQATPEDPVALSKELEDLYASRDIDMGAQEARPVYDNYDTGMSYNEAAIRSNAKEANLRREQGEGYTTKIEYAMGPARPNKPNPPVMNVIGWSVDQVLGAGARVVVTSGQEGDNPQHGSNRHKTGNAADIKIVDGDGKVLTSNDPRMKEIAKAAAANGALGIGFGSEYMGGEHMHIDLVPPGKGQSNTWASGAKSMRQELSAIMSGNTPPAQQGDITPGPAARKYEGPGNYITQADRARAAQAQFQETAERVGLVQYQAYAEDMQDLDAELASGGIDFDTYQQQADTLRVQHNRDLTQNDITHELGLRQGIMDRVSQVALEDRQYEGFRILQESTAQIERLAQWQEDGSMSPEGVQRELAKETRLRREVYRDYDLPFSPASEANWRAQADENIKDMVKQREAVRTVDAEITHLSGLGMLDTGSKEAQARALEVNKKTITQQVKNMQAQGASPQEMASYAQSAMEEFLTTSGVVDPTLKSAMQAGINSEWLEGGALRPGAVQSMQQFQRLMAINPDYARQYLGDDLDGLGKALLALDIAQGTSLEYAMETVSTAPKMEDRPESWVESFDKNLESNIEREVKAAIPTALAAMGNDTSLEDANSYTNQLPSRVLNVPGTDGRYVDFSEGAILGPTIARHAETWANRVMATQPGVSASQAARIAAKEVMDQGAILGQGFVMPGRGEPSIRQQMFGSAQVTNPAAMNTAIVRYLRSDAVREANPGVDNTSWMTDIPSYSVTRIGNEYWAEVSGSGKTGPLGSDSTLVRLPLRGIGQQYLKEKN
tara:strand:+ start:20707 stop:23934 length:3228 start_codon:yes stop_codon:yes gene_type:complete